MGESDGAALNAAESPRLCEAHGVLVYEGECPDCRASSAACISGRESLTYPRPFMRADFIVNVPALQRYWTAKREDAAGDDNWQEADDVILLLETIAAVFRGDPMDGKRQCSVCKEWSLGDESNHAKDCDGRWYEFGGRDQRESDAAPPTLNEAVAEEAWINAKAKKALRDAGLEPTS